MYIVEMGGIFPVNLLQLSTVEFINFSPVGISKVWKGCFRNLVEKLHFCHIIKHKILNLSGPTFQCFRSECPRKPPSEFNTAMKMDRKVDISTMVSSGLKN